MTAAQLNEEADKVAKCLTSIHRATRGCLNEWFKKKYGWDGEVVDELIEVTKIRYSYRRMDALRKVIREQAVKRFRQFGLEPTSGRNDVFPEYLKIIINAGGLDYDPRELAREALK